MANITEVIDGSAMEGGGQVLRVATALGVGLGRKVRVHSIRGKRPVPGLRPQHVASLSLVCQVGGASLTGCEVGSTEVTVSPAERRPASRRFEADAGTAGATPLMVQAALPAIALLALPNVETTLDLAGGTNTAHAPNIDHVKLVLAPNLALLGIDLRVDTMRRGFYPEGGGRTSVSITRRALEPIDLSAASAAPVAVRGIVCGRGIPRATCDAVAAATTRALSDAFHGVPAEVQVEEPYRKRGRKPRTACAVQLALSTSSAATIGADVLLENAPVDPDEAARRLVTALRERFDSAGAGVDEQTADQLAPFLALVTGKSRLRCARPTCHHLQTSISLASRFTGAKFSLLPQGDDAVLLECDGRPSGPPTHPPHSGAREDDHHQNTTTTTTTTSGA